MDFQMSDSPATSFVPGRSCGSCTLCCKVMAIEELNKPVGQWCRHCAPGTGCKIYESRPNECRNFNCAYLLSRHLGEEWKPERSRMVLVIDEGGMRMAAYVDPQRPAAWKSEPYYSQLKQWSKNALTKGGQVIANVNRHVYLITPNEDIDLGVLAEDEAVEIAGERDVAGTTFIARNISKIGRNT
jgi:hypothetical protein